MLSVGLPAALAMATLVGLNALEARRSQERALLATARAVSAAVDLDLARSMEAVQALAISDPVSERDWRRTRLRVQRMGIGANAWVVISDLAGAPLLNTVQGINDGAPRLKRCPSSRMS